jgi:hypothetical protein
MMADDLSIQSRDASNNRQIRFVTHIFIHPDYDDWTFANDIGVVRASVPFYSTPTLRPLPRSPQTPADNEACQLAGWYDKQSYF